MGNISYDAKMGEVTYRCPHGGGVAVFHRHVVRGEWDLSSFYCLHWDCRVARGRIDREAYRPLSKEWRRGLRKAARARRKQHKLSRSRRHRG